MIKKILAALVLLSATLAMAAVDVNKATEAELDSVKGIGPGTSKLIIQERKKGDFKSWDDFISRVKGVGEARATHLSEAGLTVGGKGYTPASSAAKANGKAGKDAKAEAKADKQQAKGEAKADKKDDKAAAARPAASAAKK
ncbi:helix-hairpin-helix domain-containing protein [Ramlibacter tataouinensis]|nr:helix-hairpin-helix domain-containing protein [Ramlibacter tataouinensis]WBY04038.1 helix-hairpin-helix domain-containing protein [Ramlibacter tataouinensis]